MGLVDLGFSGTVPVEVFVPVMMFSILFGLSMDYEVFLVSRIHEQWLRTGDNGWRSLSARRRRDE